MLAYALPRDHRVRTIGTMVREPLTERLNLRLAESELEVLRMMSKETGLTMSDVIRQLIRAEAKRRERRRIK